MNKLLAAFDRGFAKGVEHEKIANHSCYDGCKVAGCQVTALRAKLGKLKSALAYYAEPCEPGCSPCDHLIARQCLGEIK